MLPLLDAMPAERYGFVPAGDTFAGARTFGEQARHAATVIFLTAAMVQGEPSPFAPGPGDNGPADIQAKEDVIRYMKDAFAYARRTAASFTAANQLELIASYFGPLARIDVFMGVMFHSYDHYGQMAVYARLAGTVPPGVEG